MRVQSAHPVALSDVDIMRRTPSRERSPEPAPPPTNSHAAPAAKKKTRIQARNEQGILDAAQEVFAELGFHGATMDLIAGRARIPKPNLHYYFRTKQELYVSVLMRTLDIWLGPLARLDPNGDPAEELGAYIAAKVEMSEKYPSASRVYANEILNGAPFLQSYLATELRDLVKRERQVMKQWMAEGKIADIDPVHLLFMIWACTQHFADFLPQVKAVLGVRNLGKSHFQQITQSLCSIMFLGILPRTGGQNGKRPAVARRKGIA
jgi:TetR/AcrR family transcriptional regulator